MKIGRSYQKFEERGEENGGTGISGMTIGQHEESLILTEFNQQGYFSPAAFSFTGASPEQAESQI